MAQIPEYSARTGLQPAATPGVEVSNTGARALQNLGAGISDFGAIMQERQDKKDAFKADNAYRRFGIEMQNDLETQAQNITPGGDGFTRGFVDTTFKPKRDAFLASLPPKLRPQFETVLNDETGADSARWATSAATVERDEGYRWAKEEITLTQQQMATAIARDPAGYDAYHTSGLDLIKNSPLPTPEKALLEQQWNEMAQVSYLNQMLETDPQGVLRELGVDARQLSPTTQFEVLSRSVQWQESTDNPNAISPKGAVGLMQVMPDTAKDIAAALGDENFPKGGSRDQITQYLTNPFVNKQYGEEYLRQQLRTFGGTRNPIETALVAYNAGPGTAQQWVESGYDDSMLPKETRDYKTEILGSISAPTSKGDPSTVQFTLGDGTGKADLEGVNPDLTNRVADAFATLGLPKARINSGHRSEEENKAAGGAESSQHLAGGALDINVAGMPLAQRVELIKSLSAAGVTGIGIGANIIHADVGGRRAWGYASSAGGGDVPKWAAGVIAEHLKGTTPKPTAVNSRFASLPYDRRQQYLANADQKISQQNAASSRSSAVQKVEIRNAIANEIATVRATGTTTGQVDDTAISTILGEDDYLKYVRDRDTAQRTFTATDGMNVMASEEMTRRMQDYEPIPGAADFAIQQEVYAAVQRENNRVIQLRATNPAGAAMEYPEVAGAYAALQTTMQNGDPPANEVQGFVRLMLEKQAGMDIAPDARAPIPADWALEIGRAMSRVPEPAGRNLEDVRYNIQAQYNALQAYFGDYTDEVLIYALSEYKGISTTTAETVTGYMKAIQAGGDPFRSRAPAAIDQSLDNDAVTNFGGAYAQQQIDNYNNAITRFTGAPASGTAAPMSTGMSPEEMLRQQPIEE